jgi:hypothetical protein
MGEAGTGLPARMSHPEGSARLLVVGGHSRGVGKTSLVVDLIRAFPEAAWTAVKITQYGHGVCARHGGGCDCAPQGSGVALDEERERGTDTDTSRFLAAGAVRALWLRARQGRMAETLPLLRGALARAGNFILESNTVLQFARPVLYLAVLDPACADFKPSARLALDRADAFVLRSPLAASPWSGVSPRLLEGKPRFLQPLGEALPEELRKFVQALYFASGVP